MPWKDTYSAGSRGEGSYWINYVFITGVTVRAGVVLHYITLRGVYGEWGGGRISEKPLKIMQSSTTPSLTTNSVLKHLI